MIDQWMQARYPGQCRCGAKFEKGARIVWARRFGVIKCRACTTEIEQGSAPDLDRMYEDQCRDTCGL